MRDLYYRVSTYFLDFSALITLCHEKRQLFASTRVVDACTFSKNRNYLYHRNLERYALYPGWRQRYVLFLYVLHWPRKLITSHSGCHRNSSDQRCPRGGKHSSLLHLHQGQKLKLSNHATTWVKLIIGQYSDTNRTLFRSTHPWWGFGWSLAQ